MTADSDTGDDKTRLLEALCRHIVSLTWVDVNTKARRAKTGEKRAPEALAVSAFVISVKGVWFLVTAGHVIRQLEQRLADGRRIVTARIMDGFATDKALPPIPFPLSETPCLTIYKSGFDYALLPLRPGYALPLLEGGVLALDEAGWKDPPKAAHAHFLLGFPAEVTKTSVVESDSKGAAFFRVGTPLLPVETVEEIPEEFQYQPNRFFGRVPIFTQDDEDERRVEDIEGMSGGPIFAVRFSKKRRTLSYWVVAVQSKWLKKPRLIAGCPIQPVADAIAESMSEHREELAGHKLPKVGKKK